MIPSKSLVLALGAFLSLPLSPVLASPVQKADLTLPSSAVDHRAAVKKIFVDSYETYKKYAWKHDDVSPISKGFTDGRNGWGASIVDAMSTMVRVSFDLNLFSEAVDYVGTIDFSRSRTSDTVSVFETTIRYVGGLLSAYELSNQEHPVLLTKAKEVAEKLAFAWVGTSDVPFGHIDFSNNVPKVAVSNIAEAGTLTLEWATLSKYTGNDTYRQLSEKSLQHIANLGAPLPGLPAQGIDPATGQAVGGYVTWGGGSDSYFEYLIKYARLNNSVNPLFADSWRTAVDSSIKTLLKTSSIGDHVYLADYDSSKRIRHVSSHLACFHGGNWLFGGKLLNNDTIVRHGLELVDACWNTYASTATGIGPEAFAFKSSDGDYTGGSRSAEQEAFYLQHGFYITSSYYILRPEVLESNFYAWRVTGDTKYLDRAASAIDSFNKYLKAGEGFAGLTNIDSTSSDKVDDTESFWFAEVLKYLYLTFDDPSHISLDSYVFNTEAHPFKAAAPVSSYGTGNNRNGDKPFTPTSGELPAVSSIPFLSGLGLQLQDTFKASPL
ncbi:glycoside hydrolase family 47 protein [Crucibulum laeve]|uniref:alpha-1,2-Mannosidase n=1 Tax=Crucibulum laeve TaxID=68775 RepID=A0A5C3LR54_9AGAR|nr:glycoside hydrolase family 47 protein [Crucibulum laeve]